MTPSPSMLPVSGEQHKKAIEVAVAECTRLLNDEVDGNDAAKDAVVAYFASLAAQGVRLVDRDVFVREVAEWLRGHTTWEGKPDKVSAAYADGLLARFGGGDER